MPQTLSPMASSPLRRLPLAEGNSSQPLADHHDPACDTHASTFSEVYWTEDRGKRAASDTLPRPRDMISSHLRVWHSSESLPPLSFPHNVGFNTGICLLQTQTMRRIQTVLKTLETILNITKNH